MSQLWKVCLTLVALAFARAVCAQDNSNWLKPIAPFKIADGLYYVGGEDLPSYLVVTPQGHILINSGVEGSPALIRTSIEQLGFKYSDIRILLISHAHFDHDAGSARIIRETGRQIHGDG